MFTGIVEHVGTLKRQEPAFAGARLLIDAAGWPEKPLSGESICVSGVCLTLVGDPARTDGLLAFDAVPETLRRTSLGRLKPGERVNLERSATPATLLGGHVVQGHVEGLAAVVSVSSSDGYRIRLRPPASLMEFITPKGAVTLDGVSLTVAAIDPGAGWLEVALIPTTLEKTTLGLLKPGWSVNIETDIMARTVVHWAKHYQGHDREEPR